MNETQLFRVRIALVQAFLRENGFNGVLLSRVDNFAAATGGKRNYVNVAGDLGANSLFVARDGESHFVGNNVEATRQMAEELGSLGCGCVEFPWFKDTAANVARKSFGGTLASDDGTLGPNVHSALGYLRALLTEAELEKYRRIGRLAAEAMMAALDAIEAGTSEADVAATLIAEGAKRRCLVPVCLVAACGDAGAADGRIARFRHPLPTLAPLLTGDLREQQIRGYVMVVGGFVREGLVVSITRFKRVGPLPAGIGDAYNRICGVDALMQEATQPGKTLGDVFDVCREAYAKLGFPKNEWHNHHQGGATGYGARTCKATPGEQFPLLDARWSKAVKEIAGIDAHFGHAVAWNPSAAGVKSEDTFILLPDGRQEIVTLTPSLPRVDLDAVLGRETRVVKSGIAGT